MSLFKLEKIKKDKHFFKRSVLGDLKLLAILQFVVGVYTFSLWVEVLLVPVLALLGAMLAIAETDRKHRQVKVFLEYCLSSFGVVLIVYTLYMLMTNFGEFGKEKNCIRLLCSTIVDSLLLTICFLHVGLFNIRAGLFSSKIFNKEPVP